MAGANRLGDSLARRVDQPDQSGEDQLALALCGVVNVKLAPRFVCLAPPPSLRSPRKREITSDLSTCGLSRMASSCIRIEERETGMAGFIIRGGIFAMHVRQAAISEGNHAQPPLRHLLMCT